MAITIPPAYFIDIETVPQYKDWLDVPNWQKECFVKKFKSEIDKLEIAISEQWEKKAALYAEFCKIVSISIGKLTVDTANAVTLRIKNIVGRDEQVLLKEFLIMIQKAEVLCAHNGKEFDFPVLFRRLLINNIRVPNILNCIGKKQWEYPLEDTLEFWSGSQWKYKSSLDVIAQSLGFESPKADMTGADVAGLFYFKGELPWEEEDALKKIGTYNNVDVVTLARVYCKLKQLDITIDQVVYA
jgi:uncharacterized protein YprB with RNaseH-like and TPR domain